MPYQKTPRTEARNAASRAKIVKAARFLFMTQGFEQTTMQQIVAVAETSIGNCYFYFSNKNAIFDAVAEDIIQELDAAMEQIVERLEGPGRYAVLMYAVCKVFLEHAELSGQILNNPEHGLLRARVSDHFHERLRQLMLTNPLTQNRPDFELIVDAWQGAQSNLLQRALTRDEPADPAALARFLLRWNLQALGIPAQLVDAAAAALEQAIAQDLEESQASGGAPA